ncbi:MAG: UDP-3-O-acylglucosamine N-acyltransferase [Phycisphaerae bacterium]|nr:UDP-3-O-acylglucosamine N-acyltransferase [Phycisphaerae bacterium]
MNQPVNHAVTLRQLSEHLAQQGMACQIEGTDDLPITAVNTLESAGPTEISFLANPRYERLMAETKAGAVIVNKKYEAPRTMRLVRTKDPYAALMASIVYIHGHRQHPQWGIHPQAIVSMTAQLGARANIGPGVTIESDVVIGDDAVIYPGCYIASGCRIGQRVLLYPNVIIYDFSQIGNEVTIHAGTVIGEDGLGYAPVQEQWFKIPQVGRVIIEDQVEIGANCTIDRATLGTTVIGRGSKFSNLIAIGHGTRVGENAMFVAQVGLAGSVQVGKNVQMGGQAGVVGHISIGDHAIIGAKAGVINDVPANEFVLGAPAIKGNDAKRVFMLTHKLPEMKQKIKVLEAEINALRAQMTSFREAMSDGV